MRITKITAWPVVMRLAEPYTIAYETITSTTNVFVRIATDGGLDGFGCAAPDAEITGETAESVLAFVDQAVEPVLRGADPFRHAWLFEQIGRQRSRHPSGLAAIDMALFDLMARAARLPLWKMLGGFREGIVTSVTVGIMPEYETIELSRGLVARGFRALKIKGGNSVEEDIARIVKVREQVGKEIELRFDANQGYSVAEAVRFCKGGAAAEVQFLEQPTPKAQPELLARVKRNAALPVMADESVMNSQDALALIRDDCVDMFNIKLMKCGGLTEALRLEAIAAAAGVPCMIGCMDESALAIAAGLGLALARPNVHYADLDGHLDLIDDPAAGAVTLRDGMLYPSERPGLGCEPQ